MSKQGFHYIDGGMLDDGKETVEDYYKEQREKLEEEYEEGE